MTSLGEWTSQRCGSISVFWSCVQTLHWRFLFLCRCTWNCSQRTWTVGFIRGGLVQWYLKAQSLVHNIYIYTYIYKYKDNYISVQPVILIYSLLWGYFFGLEPCGPPLQSKWDFPRRFLRNLEGLSRGHGGWKISLVSLLHPLVLQPRFLHPFWRGHYLFITEVGMKRTRCQHFSLLCSLCRVELGAH